SNLTWNDLSGLLDQGHAIGAHTASHVRLSAIGAADELHREVVESADTLSHRLGTPIDHFAFTYGDLASLSREAFEVARRRFTFVHSGMRGDNVGVSPLAIRRDPCAMIDARHNYFLYSNPFTGALLEGAGDRRHAANLARLDAWAR
ncbi:MAG: polysaccharide deacetylase family protein, partial [Planctomycetota bacterium]